MTRQIYLDDLPKTMQKLVEEAVYEYIEYNLEHFEYDGYETEKHFASVIVFNYIVSFEYTKEYVYDEEYEEYEIIENVEIGSIKEYDIDQLLKSLNVPYEQSKASESIYLNNGNTRLSTHKRPGYELHGSYETHHYEEEIIFDNEVEMYLWIRDNYGERK